jgi:hypothetical protein
MAAPKGNQNARKAKDWEGALRRALSQYEDAGQQIRPGEALKKIAENVVKLALAGSKDAIAEIANRLDGKATEHVEAHVSHYLVSELTDDELATIAAGSSEGASETTTGEAEPSGIH